VDVAFDRSEDKLQECDCHDWICFRRVSAWIKAWTSSTDTNSLLEYGFEDEDLKERGQPPEVSNEVFGNAHLYSSLRG
jgi:hypothetical protein